MELDRDICKPIVRLFRLLTAIILLNANAQALDSVSAGFSGSNSAGDPQNPAGELFTLRPKVALALSGGGARGIAHVGVIKALQEAGIPIDGIAGTSMGAVIGGFYAAGYSVKEMEEIARSIEWSSIFLDAPARKSLPLSRKSTQSIAILDLRFDGVRPYIPAALTAGQKLSSFLVDRLNRAPYRGEPTFDYLKIPFTAVCTDLNSGERVLIRQGDLAEAIFASMALPLIIAPVHHRDRVLIDGGVAENIPVRAARELGQVVIAVDVTLPPVLGSATYEPWTIANQVTGLMQQEKNRQLRAEADLVITPLPDSLTNFALTEPGLFIEIGYRATKEQIPMIQDFLARTAGLMDTTRIPVRQVQFHSEGLAGEFESNSSACQAVLAGQFPQRKEIVSDLQSFHNDHRVASASAQVCGDTLVYIIEEDPVITSIELTGVTQTDPEMLLRLLTQKANEDTLLRYSDLRFEALLRAYRHLGNPLAKIARIHFDGNGRLSLHIDEGAVRSVRTEGAHHLSSGRILRDFSIDNGERLNLGDLTAGLDELYGSDLFNLVRATIIDGVVTIKVQERTSPRLRLGAGVDSERHGRGLIELSHESLPLLGGSLRTWIKYGEFDERYELTYRNLALLKTYLEGSASVISSRTEYHYYDEKGRAQGLYHFDRLGVSAHIGQQFHTWGRLVFGFQATRIRSDHRSTPPELDLRRLFLRSELDTQDRTDFPSSGLKYDFLLESAASALGGDVSYSRMHLQISQAQPITRRITFLGNLQGGISDQATPFPEWFRLGGEDSFYGLHQEELAGRQFVTLSLELREDLLSRFLADAYVSIRGDLGAIWEDLEADVSSHDFNQALGLCFALDTFLGPLSISYGHLLARHGSEARNQLYFNLGHRF